MEIDIGTIQPIVALAAGILILLVTRLLNYIVAIYLIVIVVMGLINRCLETGSAGRGIAATRHRQHADL